MAKKHNRKDPFDNPHMVERMEKIRQAQSFITTELRTAGLSMHESVFALVMLAARVSHHSHTPEEATLGLMERLLAKAAEEPRSPK